MTELDADMLRYKIAAESYSLEWGRTERLDSKISSMTSTAVVVTTLFLGLGTFGLERVITQNPFLVFLRLLIVFGLLFFGVDVVLLFRAHKVKSFRYDPNLKALIGEFAKLSHPELLLQVTSNIVDATLHNRETNDSKAADLERASWVLSAAVVIIVLFGIALVFSLTIQ